VGSWRAPALEAWCDMTANRSAAAGDQPISDIRFLTVAEVAAVMRVSNMTVYRLVHSGELPAARVGRSFRVPETAVNEYLRKSYFQAG
jgi:excisionase family DNA binding protein